MKSLVSLLVITVLGVCASTGHSAATPADSPIAGVRFDAKISDGQECFFSPNLRLSCVEALQEAGILAIDALKELLQQSLIANNHETQTWLAALAQERENIAQHRVTTVSHLSVLNNLQKLGTASHAPTGYAKQKEQFQVVLDAAKVTVDNIKVKAISALAEKAETEAAKLAAEKEAKTLRKRIVQSTSPQVGANFGAKGDIAFSANAVDSQDSGVPQQTREERINKLVIEATQDHATDKANSPVQVQQGN